LAVVYEGSTVFSTLLYGNFYAQEMRLKLILRVALRGNKIHKYVEGSIIIKKGKV
jgi:hypothetical protein